MSSFFQRTFFVTTLLFLFFVSKSEGIGRFSQHSQSRPALLMPYSTPAIVGRGSSWSNAACITGVPSIELAKEMEYHWVWKRSEGRVIRQEVVRKNDRVFDVMWCEEEQGELVFWFDITSVAGKTTSGKWVLRTDSAIYSNSIHIADITIDSKYWREHLPEPNGLLVYQLESSFPLGGSIIKGEIKNYSPHGKWVFYTHDGGIQEMNFDEGVKHGEEIIWNADGKVCVSTSWIKGKEHGVRFQMSPYYGTTTTMQIETYNNGVLEGFSTSFGADGVKYSEVQYPLLEPLLEKPKISPKAPIKTSKE
jgi:hypothetical protein